MFTGYLYLFQNSILRYFIPMSINALLVLNIIIENQSSIYQELEKFKKSSNYNTNVSHFSNFCFNIW